MSQSLQFVGTNPANQEGVNKCTQSDSSLLGFVLLTERYKFLDAIYLPFGVALPHCVAEHLNELESDCGVDAFLSSEFVKRSAKLLHRLDGIDLGDCFAHVSSVGGEA